MPRCEGTALFDSVNYVAVQIHIQVSTPLKTTYACSTLASKSFIQSLPAKAFCTKKSFISSDNFSNGQSVGVSANLLFHLCCFLFIACDSQ